MFIDVNKAMIIFIIFYFYLHFRDVDHKDMSLSICKLLSFGNCLWSWHKPIHFNVGTWDKRLKIFRPELGTPIECLRFYFSLMRSKFIHVDHFDSMIGLIERKYTRFEFFSCFHDSEHWIQDFVIKRLSDIEFDDLFGQTYS